uniref:Uncharacterized protein n=1 Tax=Plectus sambesii TaxID=2011161 RepID=A0A914XNU7_9BILA
MLLDHYKDAYVDIYEFIEDCSFGTRKCNIDSDFVPILNSVYGQCFTFNHIDANMTDMTVSRAGPAFGLRLRLNIKQEDYLYSTDTAGARITVHNKGEHPFPETIGYSAKVGTRTSVGITVVETLRLPAPWGNCTSNSDIRSRVPYFYQGSYTSQGCVFSCLALKMAESCGCLHQNYPKPSGMITVNVDNKTTTVESSQLPYCNMTTKACADNAETNLLGSGEINSESCGCHPACHSNDYQAAISMSSFPSDKYLEERKKEMTSKGGLQIALRNSGYIHGPRIWGFP